MSLKPIAFISHLLSAYICTAAADFFDLPFI
jgi:hypothetical protein